MEKFENLNEVNYILYPSRWIVLITICVTNMGCQMLGVVFSPVAPLVTEYYNITGNQLDAMFIMPFIINIPGLWLGIYLIGIFDLLKSIRFGTTLVLFGAFIRAISTMPLQTYDEAMPRQAQFVITLIGQIIISAGHPILMTMSTKVSQVWFGEKERVISTPILALAPAFGAIVGQALAPRIVKGDPDNIPILNIAMTSLVTLGAIFSWVFVTHGAPITPPSRSAALLMKKPPMTFKQILQDAKKVIKNKNTLLIGLSIGGGAGYNTSLLTQLSQMMCSRNYSLEDSSMVAVINLTSGLLGAFVMGFIGKRFGLIREISKLSFGLASFFAIIFGIFILRENNLLVIGFSLGCLGFFGFAAFSMALELSVEDTYPVEAAISECWVHTNAQFNAVAMVQAGNFLYKALPVGSHETCSNQNSDEAEEGGGVDARDFTPFVYLTMVTAAIVAISFVLFVETKMNRTEADKRRRETIQKHFAESEQTRF